MTDTTAAQEALPGVIFVAGFPRSGTTWFANMFNSHPGVLYRHEILGRQLGAIDKCLMTRLQKNEELRPGERAKLIDLIERPTTITDRPPFFEKDFLPIRSPRFHQLLWLATNTLPILSPLYRQVFRAREKYLSYIMIKETRSMVNLEGVLKGINPDHSIFLVRHPCAVVQSHITGYNTKKMPMPTSEERIKWLKNNQDSAFVSEQGLDEAMLKSCSVEEFIAFRWCAQNINYLELAKHMKSPIFVSYESILDSPLDRIRDLFSRINLSQSPATEAFINRTQGGEDKSVFDRDSSSEFYSVFRGNTFNPYKWKDELAGEIQERILRITELTREKLALSEL